MPVSQAVTTIIDQDKCTGCGECIRVCPSGTISLEDGRATVTGAESLNCGHCQAVCPVEAITVRGLDQEAYRLATIDRAGEYIRPGDYDAGRLVALMRSRRSCRNYLAEPIGEDVLTDLVKIGATAPSGTNCQKWTFTVLPTRAEAVALAERINRFFTKLNRLAEKAWLRNGLKLIGKPELADYYRDYYQAVIQARAEYEAAGRERLFHDAPAVIIIGSKPGASCPAEDALLAAQNISLAAHALGLGSCLIGFAVEAMKNDPAIKEFIGLTAKDQVHAVLALGRPDEEYLRQTGRKMIEVNFYRAAKS